MADDPTLELVARYRAGDGRAADALFERYAKRLGDLVRVRLSQRLASRIGPEDVLQSAFNSFFGGLRHDRFALERRGDAWKLLVAIALNKLARQAARHQADKRDLRREQSLEVGDRMDDLLGAALLREEPSPDEAAAVADELEECLRQLAPRQRTIVELGLQGYSDADIAATVGCAEYLVRRDWRRFKARLRERLQC
jgi:RNA polymerase sigma-70 factor (ECF subfamily)